MSNTFARRFTGIAATMVIALVAVTVSYRAFVNHSANKLAAKCTHALKVHLDGNNFTYETLEITYAKAGGSINTVGRDNTVFFRAKNLKHPRLGQADMAELSAVLIDFSDGRYNLQDFSVIYPERMQVMGWYHQ